MKPGQRVKLGDNRGPTFDLIHVHGDQAWVRARCTGQHQIAPAARLRIVE